MSVRDLKSLKHGDVLVVIFLNKDFMNFENVNNEALKNPIPVIKAEDFFIGEKYKVCKKYIYVHDTGNRGIIQLNKDWKNFEWEFETNNGEFITASNLNTESITLNNKVGWKGPCMAVKNLSLCPEIIYDL